MRKYLLALAVGALAVAPAIAQAPTLTRLEVIGNHAGKQMKLAIDGEVVFEGYGHLDPPGVTWTLIVKPGDAPAPLELTIEPCETPFKAELPRDGKTHSLLIQGCDIKLLGN